MAKPAFFAVPALAAAVLLAPGAAHALTATSPVQAATKILATDTPINFQGFSPAFKASKGIPLNAVLQSVLLTVKGTAGGSVEVLQFNPLGTATVTSPGTMNLTVNGIQPLGQANASSPNPVTVPAATLFPTYVPGSATVNVAAQSHTYTWNIVPGGTNPLSYFYNNALTLQALSEFAPTISGTPGAQEGLDSSFFQLDSNLSHTFLTFGYSVPPPSTAVPGPLPILGAASAFAFSRRLRSRIKQVS